MSPVTDPSVCQALCQRSGKPAVRDAACACPVLQRVNHIISPLLHGMQVVWGELGSSPLECLSILSSEVAVPLLKSQIRHGGIPDATALELSDSMQHLVSSCERLFLKQDLSPQEGS